MDIAADGTVTAVASGGGASRAGLPAGAKIIAVDGTAVEGRQGILKTLATNFEDPFATFCVQWP